MFPSERVDEEQRLSELSSFDEEACAIDFPCGTSFFHVHLPFGGGGTMKRHFTADFAIYSLQLSLVAGGIVNLLAECV